MNTSWIDSAGLDGLSRDDCYVLLKSVPIGRIVFTESALPAIQPVNFVIDGDEVVIGTGAGSKLATAVRESIVAFEVDEYDSTACTGWSVVIVGIARGVFDPSESDRMRGLRTTPWADGDRPYFIRISPEIVRGRRIPQNLADGVGATQQPSG